MTKGLSLRRFAVLAFAALALLPMAPRIARPAVPTQIDGVALPEMLQAAGTPLRLNGVGLRTYSVFHIHIYVVGLYLPRPSNDADAILRSDATKLLEVHFVHDVGAERARQAWRNGLQNNCRLPCRLPEQTLAQFLAGMPDFHAGDESTLLFAAHKVEIAVNGRVLGTIDDPDFSRAMLANFIGAHPPTEAFKHALLGQPD